METRSDSFSTELTSNRIPPLISRNGHHNNFSLNAITDQFTEAIAIDDDELEYDEDQR